MYQVFPSKQVATIDRDSTVFMQLLYSVDLCDFSVSSFSLFFQAHHLTLEQFCTALANDEEKNMDEACMQEVGCLSLRSLG